MMHWTDGWGMGFNWIFMLAFWVLVVLGIVYLVRFLMSGKSDEKPETAVDILKKRYARGEINKEEFEAKKRDLET